MTATTGGSPAAMAHLQLKDRVYLHLRQRIVDGELETGTPLREVEVARSVGVSKTPVREAFVRLEKDGLVRQIPYRGVVVAGYTTADLREVYELRELIEGLCARAAATEASDDDREQLAANVAASRAALETNEVDELIRRLEEFDQILYRQTTNRWITDLIESLEIHQRRIGRLTISIPGRFGASVAQHEGIHAAIRARNGDAAEARMRSHIRSVCTDQLSTYRDPASAAD